MVDVETSLRDALPGDAAELTSLLLRSRIRAMPWLVSPHDELATRWWMQQVLLTEQCVRVADCGSRLLGFAAVTDTWLEQLYVDPDHQGEGVGRALLEDAKRLRPGGLRLRVFTRNAPARRFYEAHGFDLVEQSDGHNNQEREPDCTYAWTR
ncbi:MAG: GNAT family N-acetyltransferase [Actinomycetota bacterium]|nr:GNAT family N-acetyltransferase [Actinomycetota bacterium]